MPGVRPRKETPRKEANLTPVCRSSSHTTTVYDSSLTRSQVSGEAQHASPCFECPGLEAQWMCSNSNLNIKHKQKTVSVYSVAYMHVRCALHAVIACDALTIQQPVRIALMSRRAVGRIGFKAPCKGQSLFLILHTCSYSMHCPHFMHALHEMP